jgi:DNA topoisomerase-6 subunit B
MENEKRKERVKENAESLAAKQRDISVSEFFLKNRHLLGFDNPRKALLTTVKEAVDNSLDACEEAGILPEISVDIQQTQEDRFRIAVTDNGPGIVRAQIPKVFAKLLYGSKFHRLRMSRGQQGIGISAAGMYGQLTTGTSTTIYSKTSGPSRSHLIEVQIDTKRNQPTIQKDEQVDWKPTFYPAAVDGKESPPAVCDHGTCVSIEMEASYVRGRLSVDEYLKQCAVVNPHLELHYRVVLSVAGEAKSGDRVGSTEKPEGESPDPATSHEGHGWVTFRRASEHLPKAPTEIKPHPHGVELGMLIQMLKGSSARTLRSALCEDFSRVSSKTAQEICDCAGISAKAHPSRIAHQESEALFKAIGHTKLMRPPTDCLSPIGETDIVAGLQKEIAADFYTAVTRSPTVYRGNPFLIEAGLAYARPGEDDMAGDEPVRVMRFANRVPLLYMAGGCAVTKAVTGVKWKTYGLSQPKGSLPLGPMVVMVHMASVWVPFTSESKEAIAHYPEIIREMAFCLQECGRRLSVFLKRRSRQAEMDRKRNYMALYIPHLAKGLRDILDLTDKDEKRVVSNLESMLERTHLET